MYDGSHAVHWLHCASQRHTWLQHVQDTDMAVARTEISTWMAKGAISQNFVDNGFKTRWTCVTPVLDMACPTLWLSSRRHTFSCPGKAACTHTQTFKFIRSWVERAGTHACTHARMHSCSCSKAACTHTDITFIFWEVAKWLLWHACDHSKSLHIHTPQSEHGACETAHPRPTTLLTTRCCDVSTRTTCRCSAC